jgi:hypothetical protein
MTINQNLTDFEKKCLQRFRFLEEDFGFVIKKKERESYGVFITYQNPTTAIRISFEPREGGIFVLISRLIEGEIPRYPIFIQPSSILHSFYLDDVVKTKIPNFQFSFRGEKLSSADQVEKALDEVADTLQKYASDVLKGCFESFKEAEHIVKKRQEAFNRPEPAQGG